MPDTIDFAASLSAEQLAAVTHDDGPLAVLAGPGTGKTRVLTHRVAHLVRERGLEPESVVAVTFTNRAAEEMRERLAALLSPGEAERLSVGTFHALALRTLRRFADRADLPTEPTIADSSQRRRLMRELIVERPLPPGLMAVGVASLADHALHVFAQLRHAAMEPRDALARARARADELSAAEDAGAQGQRAEALRLAEVLALLARFDHACRQRGWLGLDDMIPRAARLLAEDDFAGPMLRGQVRSVLVDEFQDVNLAQFRLLEALCPPRTRPDLCVVGDDDQAIYAFRGSDDRAFERFESIWGPVAVCALTENRRSTAGVVSIASAVIGRAGERFRPDKRLVAAGSEELREAERARGPGSIEAVLLDTKNKSGSAMPIADMLWQVRRAAEGSGRSPAPWSSVAVIARAKTELQRVRAHLELAGVPVRSQERDSPLDDEAVQDVLAWARLLVEPTLDWAARRLLTRAPSSVDRARAAEWLGLFRAARRNAQLGKDGAPPVPPSVAAWLSGHLAGAADAPAGALRFCRLFDELSHACAERRADEAVMEIVRRTGAASTELLGRQERGRRITALAALVRFARARLDRLDQPRDLGALLSYYDLLDEHEQQSLDDATSTVEADGPAHGTGPSAGPSAGPLAGKGPDGDADDGAVTLVTAHSAKGLEFDTVYLPGVHPGGYPPSATQGDGPLPEWLLADTLADPRDAAQRRADEERRVFYVACTRAQRRLVLVGSIPKKVTSLHFLAELIDHPALATVTAEEVTEAHGQRDELEAMRAEYRRRDELGDALDEARDEARALAAAALVRAEESPEQVADAAAHAAEAAWRLALIGSVHRHGVVPAWAAQRGLAELGDRLLAGQIRELDVGAAFEPLGGPLKLSFTLIEAYLRCPACCYLQRIHGWPEEDESPLSLGRVVHRALERFNRSLAAADSEGAALPTLADLERGTRAAFFEVWGEDHPPETPPDEAQLLQAIAQVRVLFEKLHDPGASINEVEKRIVMPWEYRGRHIVDMKLDRVDDLGGRARIIDYKTGRAVQALTDAKKLSVDLQMGLYVRGLRHLRQDPELDGVCEYWVLSEGLVGRIGFDELRHDKIEASINGAIDGMLDGRWDPKPSCRGLCHELGLHRAGPAE
jgi:DNA helicase-2/ATP-dependent DNA helicase PcrA